MNITLSKNGHRGNPTELDLCRPTYAEIDLKALADNYHRIRELLEIKGKLLSVVKANAYGHGVRIIAPSLDKLGSDWFGVATVAEAVELRKLQIKREVLVMGAVFPNNFKYLSELKLTASGYSKEIIEKMATSTEKLDIHLKIDSGMNRLGVKPAELPEVVKIIKQSKSLSVSGVFSHLGHADAKDQTISAKQYALFGETIDYLEKEFNKPLLSHIANSGAVLAQRKREHSLSRVGILLYGSFPSDRYQHKLDLKPVMRLKSQIVQIKEVAAGQRVGYNGKKEAKKIKIAIIPIGYADGLDYRFKNFGKVLCQDKYHSIVGNICMDMTMIDISNSPQLVVGDEVILLGSDQNKSISALTVAEKLGTASYEILTNISERVPRIPVNNYG